MAAGESVLYYHPDPEAPMGKLAGVLFRMKVRIRRVKPEEILETVGGLAGLSGFSLSGAEAGELRISEEMLVLNNFSGGRLSELLEQMKRTGIPKIALKATVTPTNRSWTFYQLYEEIRQERETMSQGSPTQSGGESR